MALTLSVIRRTIRIKGELRGPDGRALVGPDGRGIVGDDGRALKNWRGEPITRLTVLLLCALLASGCYCVGRNLHHWPWCWHGSGARGCHSFYCWNEVKVVSADLAGCTVTVRRVARDQAFSTSCAIAAKALRDGKAYIREESGQITAAGMEPVGGW